MACGRFARVVGLTAGFRDGGALVGAAADTVAGLYGAACGRPSAQQLEGLRRVARSAVCKGGQRAAAELVFCILSPTWRLDPKAIAALAPHRQVLRVTRSGTFPQHLWQTIVAAVTAGVGRRDGSVVAALTSMNLLGLGQNVTCWEGVPSAPHGWRSAEHSLHASMRHLLAAWFRAECRKVSARR